MSGMDKRSSLFASTSVTEFCKSLHLLYDLSPVSNTPAILVDENAGDEKNHQNYSIQNFHFFKLLFYIFAKIFIFQKFHNPQRTDTNI